MFHPYPFKWRPFRHFSGLLVMIIRHIGKARELDLEIAQYASNIEGLKQKLERLKKELSYIQNEAKKEMGKKDREKRLKREIEQKGEDIRIETIKIKRSVRKFCKDVKKELKYFKKSDIDDYTLLYRESGYLMDLAKLLVVSSKVDNKTKEALKRQIETEMRSIEGKAKSFELQAKYLERGVASTVLLSQISPLGNKWIEGRIRRKAIEINQIHNLLKSRKGENLPEYFEKMIFDIYEIGRNTNMLMKRLKATFNSVRTKLKNSGISYPELDETQKFFEATFNRMERISKRLDHEMKDQVNKLALKLKAA